MRHCVVICGSTAVGKTELAYRVAERLGLAIISADARQCYRELNLGVAKPPPEILARVRHYFIDSHSVEQPVNAGVFQDYAYALLDGELAAEAGFLLVGGSGLYIQALVQGMHVLPAISAKLKTEVQELYRQGGLRALQQAIMSDQEFVHAGEMDNPERLMRALMVYRASGKSLFWHHRHAAQMRRSDLRICKVGIFLERSQLYANIEARVDAMLAQGLVAEVQALQPYADLPALRTIGYREIGAYLRGECSLETSVALIKQHTRNYAKRQQTWFRRDTQINWFHAEDKAAAIEYICQQFRG